MPVWSLRRLLAAACAALCAVFFIDSAVASPESERLAAEAFERLRARDAAGALNILARARAADPTDARVPLQQGFILNRVARYRDAFVALRDAEALGARHPQLDFEIGWAATALVLPEVAVPRLERHLAGNDRDAQAQFLVGRSYTFAGRYADAERALERAVALDPSLKPAVQAAQADLAGLTGADDKRRELQAQVLRDAPESGAGRSIRGAIREEALRSLREKPWAAYLSTSLGRNTNVTALSDEIVQPAEISNRASPFYSIDAGAQYAIPEFLAGTLVLGYDLNYQEFWELRDLDSFENALSARYSYALYSDILARLMLRGAHARVDNERFRNTVAVRPSLLMRPRADLEIEPFYSLTGSDYREPTTSAALLDRDSTLQTIGARVAWAIPDTPVVAELGTARLHNSAEGNDFSYRGQQYWLRVSASLPAQIDADLQWTVSDYNYTNLNSLAPTTPPGPTAFGFKRADEGQQLQLRLSRPLIPGLSAFFLFNYVDMDSNLQVFDYEQAEGRLGLLARF